MADELIALAQEIRDHHQVRGEGSWLACRYCGQAIVVGSEARYIWPCDARMLADRVLGLAIDD